ncbi:hypothetical protein SPSIL_009240 [Sporomusa silvacetica DSM 10669]|uniref:Uncharacterized protein n=1 Tax=Sporomusa silvacetica DSM 10669 TaxID=1123289 RepID=A0ABZ3IGR1_9FIRM|nr:hypothetical protein [Sporomusa silvacetica]OZC13116.1 hypothetical protein SPSIL_55720 [Sporomusa silvacetica DSM 10669]
MKKMLVLMIAMFVLSFSSIVSAHDNQNPGATPNYQMLAADDHQPQPDPNDPHHKKPQPKPHHKQQPQQPQPGQPESPRDGGPNN